MVAWSTHNVATVEDLLRVINHKTTATILYMKCICVTIIAYDVYSILKDILRITKIKVHIDRYIHNSKMYSYYYFN